MMSSSRTAILIWNPNAGRGRANAARDIERLRQAIAAHGVEVETLATRAPGDAASLVHEATRRGVQDVIVAGGDGTINEALQGLMDDRCVDDISAGSDNVRLCIWPRGTANVLARELGLPFGAEEAARVIADGRSREAFVGCAIDEATNRRRYFFLMAGIGLDASVVRGTRAYLKRRIGEAAFWYAGLEHLARWRPLAFNVEIGERVYAATFAAIGKASRYGGNLRVTPRASLYQPYFEVCLVQSHSKLRYLRLLTQAMRRNGIAQVIPGTQQLRATRLRATGGALVQVDGELIGRLPMTFEVAPQLIQLAVP